MALVRFMRLGIPGEAAPPSKSALVGGVGFLQQSGYVLREGEGELGLACRVLRRTLELSCRVLRRTLKLSYRVLRRTLGLACRVLQPSSASFL